MSIRDRLADAPDAGNRYLCGATGSVCLGDLVHGTTLGGRASELAGRSVLIATREQYAAALALIELDGVARRLIVCTPDISPEHLAAVVATADVDAIVSDRDLHTTEVGSQKLEVRTETARPACRRCSCIASPACLRQ